MNAVRCFVVVGEKLGFTKAASELHISQSAVSGQVQLHEEQAPFLVRFIRSSRNFRTAPPSLQRLR